MVLRIGEIEKELGMEISLDIQNLDRISRAKDEKEAKGELGREGVDEARIKRYWSLHQKLKKENLAPSGFGWQMIILLTDFAALAWVLVIMKFLVKNGNEWDCWRWATLGIGLSLLVLVTCWTWPRWNRPCRERDCSQS